MKKVSVVICTYNGERYLREQLDSILAQTYPVFEVVVQDDCSTDGTVGIIESYRNKFSNLRIIRNEHNLGFNENFHRALLQAEGDLIAISDQDDVWDKEKIARQVECIGDCNLCCSAYSEGTTQSTPTKILMPETNIERLMFSNTIPGHTMLLKREFIRRIEWNNFINYDWWIAVCAALENNIVCVNQPLNWHRKHEMSAIELLRKKYLPTGGKKRKAYQPYLYGAAALKQLKQKESWKYLYSYIESHSPEERNSVAHKLANLLQRTDASALLQLCFCCLWNRKKIYPGASLQKSPVLLLRSFFYPFIFAYRNTNFES